MNQNSQTKIAVIGMSGRFPGASDLDAFWDNLQAGVESVSEFSDDELEAAGIAQAVLQDPRCVRAAPILSAIELFDAAFFGISVREAERIDPQQRILLECAWEALEQAGFCRGRSSERVGVYVGSGISGYLEPRMEGLNVVTELETLLGNDKDYAATRLSYKLDLQGPSVTVQTACSTSLVAIHLGCQALLNGECDLALAGGVRVRIPQKLGFIYQEGGLLSPDGRCRAFDARGNGTTFGSGVGVVALKRLEDALADGDCIDAVILGSAVNNDGASKVGFVAPSVEGQAAVIAEALAVAGIDARSVSYVEAHGTGTPLGDPIEIAALTQAFRRRGSGRLSCAVGSVKTNIGHLETAAGVAGFIKTVLALKHRALPPSLNFHEPNPHIDFANSPFHVNTALTEWSSVDGPLRAGVSSFGIGGTNAHVVLEEAKARAARQEPVQRRRVHVLPVSARGQRSLQAQAARLAAEVERNGADASWLEDACYSAGVRRTHHGDRACAVGENAAELAGALRAAARGDAALAFGGSSSGARRRVVFVYSGQGSQWVGMGRRLQQEPAFAERLRECDAALRTPAGFSVLDVLKSEADDERWKRVEVIQPLLFALQVSLSAQWIEWGVEPDAVIGHSLGEVAASVVAGSLSLEDGARVIATRSRLVSRTCGRGRMALVELGWDDVQRELSHYPEVSIASHHGRETVLISGARDAVEKMVDALQARAVFARLVDVDYASHSGQMDGLLSELGAALQGLSPQRGRRVQCSTLLADLIGGEELGGDYWVRNLREPVKFHDAVEKLVSLGHDLFIEVSPHPVLTPTLERTLGERGAAIGSVRRGSDEVRELSESLARVYVNGAELDWARRHAGYGAQMVRLPAYAWSRERHWLEQAGKRAMPAGTAGGHGWLAQSHVSAADPGRRVWQGELDRAAATHLQEHRVQGVPVVAGAVWLEAALYGARQRGAVRELADVEFVQMLSLETAAPVTVQLLAGDAGFEVLSAPTSESETWTLHARGSLVRPPTEESADTNLAPLAEASDFSAATGSAGELAGARERCKTQVDAALFYDQARARGIDYGERYAGLSALWLGEDEAVAELSATSSEPGRWEIEPWALDACLQVLGATQSETTPGTFLPVRIGRLRVSRRFRDRGWVHARRRRVGPDQLEGDVRLYDQQGGVVLDVSGIRLQRVGRRRDELEDWLFKLQWQAQALPRRESPAAPGTWLVLRDGPLGGRVMKELEAAGARCIGISRHEPDGLERALVSERDCRGIAFLWAAEEDAAGAQIWSSLALLALAQALAKLGGRESPRLWIVTRATQALAETDVVHPLHAPLWGLSRSLVHEHPELRPTCVDLPARCDDDSIAALVAELVNEEGSEDQIALRPHGRFVARLMRAALDAPTREIHAPAGDRPFALETRRPGTFEALSLRASARPAPGPFELEIEVEAAGLNLLDVLLALGALPDDAPGADARGPRLGGECAGRVVRVGPSVTRFAIGDRVLAMAPGSFRSFAIAPEALAALLPKDVPCEVGAGFPIAFLTAHFALRGAARLQRNERVLIHAASTGVGLAAVQIALQIGAQVFATAGSAAKRERLRALGVRHVMDSRSLDFAEGVMAATAGEGVDVVLNSLSGEFIAKSLGVLREHGRYVEIGKRDYYQDMKLGLRPFLKGLTLALVDLRGMLHTRPQAVAAALSDLVDELGSGHLKPLPVETFPASSAADAFRHLAQAKHLGKVVITFGDRAVAVAPAEPELEIRADGSYLISGGLGGLGLELARHLVSRGAKRLVLMGRRAPSEAAAAVVAELRRTATVLVAEGDVAREEDVARVLRAQACSDAAAPLRGVIHAAGVLDDGVLVQQNAERFAAVLAPKVAGAWNLHVATERLALDFFVLFSSMASLLGAPAQASYAAGNAFLDALAQHRRARGLSALSINWGAWGEVGLAAAQDNRAKRVSGQGMESLSTAQGVAAFARLLSSPHTQIAVAPLNLRQWFQSHPLALEWPLLSALVGDASVARAARQTRFKDALHSARVDARRRMLHEHLAEQVASVLRIPPERVESSTTLASLGMDSLTALEFRNRLEQSLGLALRATLIWAHPSTAGLAEFIAKQLGLELALGAEPAPAVVSAEEAIAEDIDGMSESEAEAALRSVLDGMGAAE